MAEEKVRKLVEFRTVFPTDIQAALDVIVKYGDAKSSDAVDASKLLVESLGGSSPPHRYFNSKDVVKRYTAYAQESPRMAMYFTQEEQPDGTLLYTHTWRYTIFAECVYDYKYERSSKRSMNIVEFPKDVKAALDQAILYRKAARKEHDKDPDARPRIPYEMDFPEWAKTLASLFRRFPSSEEREPVSVGHLMERLWYSGLRDDEQVLEMFWWMRQYGCEPLLRRSNTDVRGVNGLNVNIVKWERI